MTRLGVLLAALLALAAYGGGGTGSVFRLDVHDFLADHLG